jgi:ribosomal protein L24
MPRHIVKGDTVIVTSGSAKGSVGEVIRVLPDEDRVVVSGVNVRNKRIPRSQQNPQGGSIRAEAPIHISNVSPVVDGLSLGTTAAKSASPPAMARCCTNSRRPVTEDSPHE